MKSNKSELISVVIPVFRVEKYIDRCIISVINQTYKNIEIILVDDGSDDNSPQICDKYSTKDKRIKVIHKKNGGLSDARNVGIKASIGKYITFIDSDDCVDEDYIEFLYNTLKENNADISICAYKAVYDTGAIISQENGKKMVLNDKETLEKMLYQEDFNVAACAKMYKLSLFEEIQFPVGKIFEDAFTTYKVVLKSKVIACNMISKYNYMIRSNSILTSKFSKNKLTLIDAYDEMGDKLLKIYPDIKNAVIRGKVYARISTLRQMINCKPRLKEEERKIREYVLKNTKIILNDKRVGKRDKIAVICLILGNTCFKYSWNLYCKFTGRNM